VSLVLVGSTCSTFTSTFSANKPHNDSSVVHEFYNPLFIVMLTTQGMPPVFNLTVLYNDSSAGDLSDGGMLALDDLPDIPCSPTFASMPIQWVDINNSSRVLVYEYSTVVTDDFAITTLAYVQFDPNVTHNLFKTSLIASNT